MMARDRAIGMHQAARQIRPKRGLRVQCAATEPTTSSSAQKTQLTPKRSTALFGWRYPSNATCLIQASFVS